MIFRFSKHSLIRSTRVGEDFMRQVTDAWFHGVAPPPSFKPHKNKPGQKIKYRYWKNCIYIFGKWKRQKNDPWTLITIYNWYEDYWSYPQQIDEDAGQE